MTPSGAVPSPDQSVPVALNLLIVGHGKMGRLVEQLALEQGHRVSGVVDLHRADWDAPADVAIDFSTADALADNFTRYVARSLNVVIGTTGWGSAEPAYREQAKQAGLGVVASANFSVGVNLFEMIVAEAARLMAPQAGYGAWIHEAHHAAKRDAPSGTAILLRDAMTRAGFSRTIDISSTRAGAIPGTHTIGFDALSDTIELTHTARDRRGFAAGALLAAAFVARRHGWYTMADVLRG